MMMSVEITPTKPSTVTPSPVKLSVSIIKLSSKISEFKVKRTEELRQSETNIPTEFFAILSIPYLSSTVSITYNTHHDGSNGGKVEQQSVQEGFGESHLVCVDSVSMAADGGQWGEWWTLSQLSHPNQNSIVSSVGWVSLTVSSVSVSNTANSSLPLLAVSSRESITDLVMIKIR